RLEGDLGRPRPEQLPRAGEDHEGRGRRPQLLAVRLAAAGRPLRSAHLPLSGGAEPLGQGGARGLDLEDRRGPGLLLPAARPVGRGGRQPDRHGVLQAGVPQPADGVRRRGAEAARREPGRECRLMARQAKAEEAMLEIRNLHAGVEGKAILRGVDLTVRAGEVHAIMGPNGSGKSTLAQVLAGREAFEVTGGEARFEGKDLLAMAPEERAREGVFLAFQYPVEIPGVSNTYFLKAAANALRKHRGLEELDAMDFLALVKEKAKLLRMDPGLLNRPVNEGFSGGEKKRNEVFQMAVLEPKLAVLDETDSGLDIDALRVVADGVNAMQSPERAILLVTHYQRLLNYIVPDFVHVLVDGRIVRSGRKELALELEAK